METLSERPEGFSSTQTGKSIRISAERFLSFINKALSQLYDSSNQAILGDIFTLLKNAVCVNESGSLTFLQSTCINKADHCYVCDSVLWILGQFTNIVVSGNFSAYDDVMKSCQLSLIDNILLKNDGVFNSVAFVYVNFIRDVINVYKLSLTDGKPFSVEGLSPTYLTISDFKVQFITEFHIQSSLDALKIIDIFLAVLESLPTFNYFNHHELLDLLFQTSMLGDPGLKCRSLRLSVPVLALALQISTSELFVFRTVNLWLGRLLSTSVNEVSLLPACAELVEVILTSSVLDQLSEQLFGSILYLLIQHLPSASTNQKEISKLSEAASKLLDKVPFDPSIEDCVCELFYISSFNQEVMDLVSKFSYLSMKHSESSFKRGLKRKRPGGFCESFVYDGKIWSSFVNHVLDEIAKGPSDDGILYLQSLFQLALKMEPYISEVSYGQRSIYPDEFMEVCGYYIEDCCTEMKKLNLTNLLSTINLFLQFIECSSVSSFMTSFINFYSSAFHVLCQVRGKKEKGETLKVKLLALIRNTFLWYEKQSNYDENCLINLWHTMCDSLKDQAILNSFKENLPMMIVGIRNEDIRSNLTQYLSCYITQSQVDNLILCEPWSNQLACFLSNRCFVKRNASYEPEMFCADCQADEFDERHHTCIEVCIFATDEEKQKFIEKIQVYFIDLLLGSEHSLSLFNHLIRYSRHFKMMKPDQLLIKSLLRGSITMKHTVCQIILDYFTKKLNPHLNIEVDTVLKVILRMMSAMEFWNSQYVPEVVYRILSAAVVNQSHLISCLKLIHLFLVGGPNFGKVRLKETITKICSMHNTSYMDLVMKFREDFSLIIMLLLQINHTLSKEKDVKQTVAMVLEKVKYLFDSQDGKSFMKSYLLPSLLPQILIHSDKDIAIKIMLDVAEYFSLGMDELMFQYFEDIYTGFFVEFMFDGNGQNLMDRFKIIQSSSNTTIEKLVSSSFETLICKFILNAGHPKIVLSARFLFQMDSPRSINLFSNHLLGLLTYIDSCLQSETPSSLIVSKCLQCLPNLIILLGPDNVTKMRFKLFATLRNGLKVLSKKNPNLYFTSWALFIYSVDLSVLGASLSNVFVSLLPLLDTIPLLVANLLHFLVVTNKEVFLPYIPDLYFVQDSPIPAMHQVWLTIQQVIADKKETFLEEAEKLINHIGNDDIELKLHALKRLNSLLSKHSVDFNLLIVRSDILHPLVVKIIDCLMATLTTCSAVNIREVCAACLGELGAIDPTRIDYKLNEECLNKPLVCVTKSLEFAEVCISGLVKGLQNAKDLQLYNTFVGSTHGILKVYFKKHEVGCKENLFSKFPLDVKEILETLFHAKYRHMVPHLQKFNFPHPIFGYKLGGDVLLWAYRWSLKLISFINDPFDVDLFLCCAPCMKVDLDFLLLILPYILLRAILTGTPENKVLIEEEMKEVLHWMVFGSRQRGIIHIWKRIGQCGSYTGSNFTNQKLDPTKCVGVIFDLLDFLSKYSVRSNILVESKEEIKIIQATVREFLGRFHLRDLCVEAYVQKDYCRALWHVEKMYSQGHQSEYTLQQLRNIFCKLHDADGLIGVMGALQTIPSTTETLLSNVVKGNLQEALIGYRLLASEECDSEHFQRGLIQCYLNMDQTSTALQVTKSLCSVGCPAGAMFSEYCETLWRDLRWNELSHLTEALDPAMANWSWSVDVGLILAAVASGQSDLVFSRLAATRLNLAGHLAGLSYDYTIAYRQGYSSIVKLHALNELEKYCSVFRNDSWENILGTQMQLRLNLVQASEKEQILNIRKVALSLIEDKARNFMPEALPAIQQEISDHWLKSIAIARKNGNIDHALTCVSLAEKYQPAGLFVQKAKIFRMRDQTDAAVLHLRQGITQYFTNAIEPPTSELLNICAKAKLLIAQYNDEKINVDIHDGVTYYREAMKVLPWEKACVCMAQYLYRAVTADESHLSSHLVSEMAQKAADYFGMSMKYGSQYIYQSMPCMLSLWLDFSARMVETAGNTALSGLDVESTSNVKKFLAMIDKYSEELPAYMFMTALSQMISRIGHPYDPCYHLLKKIIIKMIITFPQQASWTIISAVRSSHPMQKKRALDILRDPKITHDPVVGRFFEDFKELTNKLIVLCSAPVPSQSKKVFSLQTFVKGLNEFLKKSTHIMVPAQKFRTVSLPNLKYTEEGENISKEHYPFPQSVPHLIRAKEEVTIFQSLQMPKKAIFYGSDGQEYPLICKAKDDLRLDWRIMEFNSIVNMYLRRESNTRERNLFIKTYSVVPLSNQCGIIECIPNVLPLKTIVTDAYRKKEIYEHMPEVTKILQDKNISLKEKKNVFYFMLNKHPPVLQEWLLNQFHNPQTWYLARRGYIRSTAVMSIVGYVIGLGDRHCDNILFDCSSAHLVHVDFNCLFDKAELFTYPELVPFRLTNNLVNAMGPTGYEGTFVSSCEETARVMRKYRDHLVATIKPFLHDHKIFQSRGSSPNHKAHLEFTNESAKLHITKVQRKLDGVVQTFVKNTPPLSVEGQVRMLISEATSVDNLAQMFPGWTPWI